MNLFNSVKERSMLELNNSVLASVVISGISCHFALNISHLVECQGDLGRMSLLFLLCICNTNKLGQVHNGFVY